jgi:hypothetical protein
MSDTDEFRQLADQCLDLANLSKSPSERTGLIERARAWAMLADEAGGLTSKRATRTTTAKPHWQSLIPRGHDQMISPAGPWPWQPGLRLVTP